jgi:hypothetical protein
MMSFKKKKPVKSLPCSVLKSLEVQDIIRYFLAVNGFDGLVDYYAECGCEISDLFPCGEPGSNCIAAYRKTKPNGKWRMVQAPKKDVDMVSKFIDRLSCNDVECHQGRDILETIAEAMQKLPCNGVQAILSAAYQEISYWRDSSDSAKGKLPLGKQKHPVLVGRKDGRLFIQVDGRYVEIHMDLAKDVSVGIIMTMPEST